MSEPVKTCMSCKFLSMELRSELRNRIVVKYVIYICRLNISPRFLQTIAFGTPRCEKWRYNG